MSFYNCYGVRGPCHSHSFASLIHLLFPPNKSMLRARLSLILLRSIAKSQLSLDFFHGPPSTTIQGETPSPSLLGAHLSLISLCSIAKSRLSLDARVSPSIDTYHIVTMHLKPTKTLCSAKL